MIFSAFGIVLVAVTVGFFLLVIYEQLKEQNEITRTFTILTLSALVYSFFNSILYITSIFSIKQFAGALSISFMVITFTIWIVTISRYMKYDYFRSKLSLGLLFTIPAIFLILGLSDPFTHVFLTGDALQATSYSLIVDLGYNYALICALVSFILIIIRRTEKIKNLFALFLSLSPLIIIIINHFTNDFFNYETMPILLFIVLTLGVYALFKSKLLNIVPLSQEYFIEKINVGMLFYDNDYKIMEFNPKFLEIFNFDFDPTGYTLQQLITIYRPGKEDLNLAFKEHQFYDEKTQKYYEIKRKDAYTKNHAKIGSIMTFYDITTAINAREKSLIAQQKAEEKSAELNIANQEIDVLLKEVHHRVKNNLGMILSFINLDKRYNNDPENILDNILNRISAMALIYEETYTGDKYAQISVAGFIEESVKAVVKLYSDDVVTKFNLDKSIESNMELITPINLIINELITNSLKYAFKDYEVDEKIISIDLERISENKAALTIKDNGKGLPEGFDITKSTSLGLTIVMSLTGQIRGELTQLEGQGTGYKIEFPL